MKFNFISLIEPLKEKLGSRKKNKEKLPTIESKSKGSKKERIEKIVIVTLVFLGGAVFSYTQFFDTFHKSAEIDTVIKSNGADITKAANKKVNTIDNNKSFSVSLAATNNPFVLSDGYQNVADMSQQRQEKYAMEQQRAQNLPAIPSYGYNGYSAPSGSPSVYFPGGKTLPPIPSINNPNMPTASMPGSPQSQIQGIMTDENGNQMAIVDGKFVTAGDKLNGSTISSINNDGILFNNGNKISYNMAN